MADGNSSPFSRSKGSQDQRPSSSPGRRSRGRPGKSYIEWRDGGKRIQRPAGTTPRDALDAWRTQTAILDGTIEAPEEAEPLPALHTSIKSESDTFLDQVKATKSEGTHDAYTSDLEWFKKKIKLSAVGKVTRAD